jgi:hypothetical protein
MSQQLYPQSGQMQRQQPQSQFGQQPFGSAYAPGAAFGGAQQPVGQQPAAQPPAPQQSSATAQQGIRQAAMSLDRFESALETVRVQALERSQVQLARLCGDLVIVTHAQKKLLLRRSPFAQPIAQAVQETVQRGIQELQQHADIPEVQEAISEGQGAISTVQAAVSELSGGQQSWAQQTMGQY